MNVPYASQLRALGALKYRVTLMRSEETGTTDKPKRIGVNIGRMASKVLDARVWAGAGEALCRQVDPTMTSRGWTNLVFQARDSGTEVFFTADQLIGIHDFLQRSNTAGWNVFITPMDPRMHFLLLDDIKTETVPRVVAELTPATVLESSAGNCQAVILVRRYEGFVEREAANLAMRNMNRDYAGDPNISGAMHPFRLAGFMNRKPGRDGFPIAVVHVVEKPVFSVVLEEKVQRARMLKHGEAERARPVVRETKVQLDGPAEFCVRKYAEISARNTNSSAVDFSVACAMFRKGFDRSTIESMLREHSPDVESRHRNTDRYIKLTVANAESKMSYAR